MKKLNELIDCNYNIEIESLEDDSRVLKRNYLYFCIEGLTVDGHEFAKQAVINGAVAVVAKKDIDLNVPVIKVEDTSVAMCNALNKFYDNVENKLKVIGVTGTDGKTTTTTIIYQIINSLNKNKDYCGVIGSNGIKCPGYEKENLLTTPLPKELYSSLNEFVKNKCHYLSMEVSSERLLTKRLDGINYDIAILTNVTGDHMNKHKTMENYIECKKKLFKSVKTAGVSIINNDDKYANQFIASSNGKVITYGINNNSDVQATNIKVLDNKIEFDIIGLLGNYHINASIPGIFNVYNLMASIIACNHLGFKTEDIIKSCANLEQPKGRVEYVEKGQPYKVIIDYAHTPNALKNLFTYVRGITKNKVICVTGSAGGKDEQKRPLMGEVVTELSDFVIFTSDDPRNEDPNKIIDEMVKTLIGKRNNFIRIIDRKEAIKEAIAKAEEGDTVVIAGRGIDTMMPVNGEEIYINDYEEAQKNIK